MKSTVSKILIFLMVWHSLSALAEGTEAKIKLYALKCGHIEMDDLGAFSDTGQYDHKHGTMDVRCFLIQHPKGTLLWDTGVGPALVKAQLPGHQFSVPVSLETELAKIKLSRRSIDYLAFSHMHLDHTGNANLFEGSAWILNRSEMSWADKKPMGVMLETFDLFSKVKTKWVDEDYDVFGDGTVKVLKTPGHTPGHQSLYVNLSAAGPVIIAGDLFHLIESREKALVPSVNVDRAATLASIQRVEGLAKEKKAKVLISHDPKEDLPNAPAYWE
jgi:N-acyl homoserine lactone hydrolase